MLLYTSQIVLWLKFLRGNIAQLTEHDFICGDNGIELEGIGNDLPLTVSEVEIILMDETTTICTVTHTHTTQTEKVTMWM